MLFRLASLFRLVSLVRLVRLVWLVRLVRLVRLVSELIHNYVWLIKSSQLNLCSTAGHPWNSKKWALFKCGSYSQFVPNKLQSILENWRWSLFVVNRWSLFRGG
jgi:hypothetical protein